MVDNQHRQIPGYRDLPQETVDLIKVVKEHETGTVAFWASVKERCSPDPQASRDLALAKTAFEDAYIRLVRAVALPDSPWSGR